MAQVTVSPVAFARPSISPREIAEVVATLESGWLTTGPRVKQFEHAFARYIGAPHAVALNSCSAALHLSLLAADVGSGDEVVTTPLTFCATANAIIHAGATPVFADVDPLSMNLDPAAAEAAITPRTRALLPVHYGGRPADVEAFSAIGRSRGLPVIEDAAHCVEGVSGGRKIGTTADFTCFSFYSTKNLTTGEGGMVTTADTAAAEWIRVASLHGLSRDAWKRYAADGRPHYDVIMAGFKYNMMDLQAALGLHQLARLPEMSARRAELWARYDEALAALPLARPCPVDAGSVHARHLYTVLVDEQLCGWSRDRMQAALAERGICTSVHFRALHLHPYYAERYRLRRGQFPEAERISDQTLSLPFSAALTDEEADRTIAALREILR